MRIVNLSVHYIADIHTLNIVYVIMMQPEHIKIQTFYNQISFIEILQIN